MLKRLLLLIFMLCCLASSPEVSFSEEFRLHHGQKFFPPEVMERLTRELPGKLQPADLEALITSYPGFCLGVELIQGKLYLILKNGQKIIYDDGLAKNFEEKLDKPDLKDMLAQLYRPGRSQEPFRSDYDPGRFRVNAFFKSVYGGSASEVKANLISVNFCGTRVMFNAQNGAAQALESVGRELAPLMAKRPQLRQYLFPLGGTFFWRDIAGTNRLSPHSWGIAIDLNPKHGPYWRGKKAVGSEVEKLRNNFPLEVIELFENHGFIWGGKWSHFDLMHFEYRPEMVRKWQIIQKGTSGSP